ncbi:hypothetical protein [Rhodoblastus sp.]|uniref:hypothetical protein n=1 Tax=Rhodoblastus sp. TaxID=1962975 RepID=UPI003F9E036C
MRTPRRPDSSESQGTFKTSPRRAMRGQVLPAPAQSNAPCLAPTARSVQVSVRRPVPRAGNKIYELESDLGPDMPVTTGELDALVLLLGSDLDSFLSGKG